MTTNHFIGLIAMWLVIGALSWAYYDSRWRITGLYARKGYPTGVRLVELLFALTLGPLIIPFVIRRLP